MTKKTTPSREEIIPQDMSKWLKGPQWTDYEVKPEFRGNGTLVIYRNQFNQRLVGFLDANQTVSDLGLTDADSIQQIYRGADLLKTPTQKLVTYSNEAIDELILQRKTK